MNRALRITSETFVLTLLLLAVPTLLTAQRLGTGPRERAQGEARLPFVCGDPARLAPMTVTR